MEYKFLGKHLFFLGALITVIGLLSPWWCSGHHTFQCTNGLGVTWYNYNLEITGFRLSFGIPLAVILCILVWIEIKRSQTNNKKINILVALLFLTCVSEVIDTLLLVQEANCYQTFTAWMTRYVETIFPSNNACRFGITWITDVSYGIWLTLAGVLILLTASLPKQIFRLDMGKSLESA